MGISNCMELAKNLNVFLRNAFFSGLAAFEIVLTVGFNGVLVHLLN